MSKTFAVLDAQQRAREARKRLKDKICRHYRGGRYRVLDVAVDEVTGESVVIYVSLAFGYVWARKLDVFEEEVEWADGKKKARFEVGL